MRQLIGEWFLPPWELVCPVMLSCAAEAYQLDRIFKAVMFLITSITAGGEAATTVMNYVRSVYSYRVASIHFIGI